MLPVDAEQSPVVTSSRKKHPVKTSQRLARSVRAAAGFGSAAAGGQLVPDSTFALSGNSCLGQQRSRPRSGGAGKGVEHRVNVYREDLLWSRLVVNRFGPEDASQCGERIEERWR